MGKKIQVAYSKQPESVLLDNRPDEEAKAKSDKRDKRKEDAATNTRAEAESAINSPSQGKGNAKAKGGDRRRRQYRLTNSSRGSVGTVEEGNRPGGRNAKQLGIRWIGSYCSTNPAIPHWLIETSKTEGGSIFKCRKCGKVKWLPTNMTDAILMGSLFSQYGFDAGYQMMLDRYPHTRNLIARIQDISYLQHALPADQLPVAVAAVMTDPEYPYPSKDSVLDEWELEDV